MSYNKSGKPSANQRAVAILHRGGLAVIAMAGVFVIKGTLLTTGGYGRSSAGSHEALGASIRMVADRERSAGFSSAPANSSAATQYVSNVDVGQALISGTSTLHDWTVKTDTVKGTAKYSGQWKSASGEKVTLGAIDIVIPVDSLKSTEGSGMDKTMYDAMNIQKFPTITYSLIKASLKSSPSGQDPAAAYHFDTAGRLTVAGSARLVNLDLAVVPHDDGPLTITSDIDLKMTDFGITPPTAMLGMIKSGDAVTVKVSCQLKVQPVATAAAGK